MVEFLGFVDGDDMVPPGAYEVLVHTLELSGYGAGVYALIALQLLLHFGVVR